jgi:hypothetical protein
MPKTRDTEYRDRMGVEEEAEGRDEQVEDKTEFSSDGRDSSFRAANQHIVKFTDELRGINEQAAVNLFAYRPPAEMLCTKRSRNQGNVAGPPGQYPYRRRYTGPTAHDVADRIPGSRPEANSGFRLRGRCHGHGSVRDSSSLAVRDSTTQEGGLWVKCWASCSRQTIIEALEFRRVVEVEVKAGLARRWADEGKGATEIAKLPECGQADSLPVPEAGERVAVRGPGQRPRSRGRRPTPGQDGPRGVSGMAARGTNRYGKNSPGYRMWVLQRAQAKLRQMAQDGEELELATPTTNCTLGSGSGRPPWATPATPRSR